ncbi:methylmalonic aciduria and homocystinuria type D protein [Acaryochloris sp. IP29b_bin.137]|uniref:methylmalonic aciduria and homocystinuria type D protein n=1 Tax=Acaryochloris sp. IP29b_bin.137 TaxID=2969217 RepID=UPI002617C6D8|nr:methylmalonic aciduria and homocystinuria type D protein [Acaryochloris sp. IP29b_bin.137]
MGIEYSVHIPSEFISTNVCQLLPDWLVPVLSVIIVFQHCPVLLLEKTTETEFHKQQLRAQFVQLGRRIVLCLQHLGYQAEIFDPRTGYPILSHPGPMRLDDVAVVQTSLGYPLAQTGGCRIIEHPIWGNAVYPSILLSSAEPNITRSIAKSVMTSYIC